MKHTPALAMRMPMRKRALYLAALLIFGTLSAGCAGNSGSSGSTSSTLPSIPAQVSAVTPVGALPTCLTLYPPALQKLADGHYRLSEQIDNCGGLAAGPLTVTARIDTASGEQSAPLLGPATLAGHGKALYATFAGPTGGANNNKEIALPVGRTGASALVTLLATINGAVVGEWDGQPTIPAR